MQPRDIQGPNLLDIDQLSVINGAARCSHVKHFYDLYSTWQVSHQCVAMAQPGKIERVSDCRVQGVLRDATPGPVIGFKVSITTSSK